MKAHNPFGAEITNESEQWAQLAIQGPRAIELGEVLLGRSLADVKNYWFTTGTFAGVENCILARTGYTGEDGVEIFCPPDSAARIWSTLLALGAPMGAKPAGLGARNTLRLEPKMALYGNDIDEYRIRVGNISTNIAAIGP